jgi:hypothetical protein
MRHVTVNYFGSFLLPKTIVYFDSFFFAVTFNRIDSLILQFKQQKGIICLKIINNQKEDLNN